FAVTTIPLGRLSPERLDATYPHTPRARSTCAYLVLLRVEIARFTLRWPVARLSPRPRPLRLVSVALILTSRWRGVTSYAALRSPDLPPVRPFGPCTSGGLANFTRALSPLQPGPGSQPDQHHQQRGHGQFHGRVHDQGRNGAGHQAIGGAGDKSLQ